MKKIRNFLIILFSIILFLLTPQLVYAIGENAGGSGHSGTTTEGVSGGASFAKTGFRMYIVDENGTVKSKVVDLVNNTPSYLIKYSATRIGNGNSTETILKPSDMPLPVIHSGSFQGNGQAVRAWMIARNASGEQNAYKLIYDYLGAEAYESFIDITTNQYLILEPIAYHDIFTGNSASSNSGIGFYGSFYNWMQMYSMNGLADGGFTASLDNNVLGRCMTLVRDQANLNLTLPTTSGNLDLYNVGNQGFGIQIYWNSELLLGNNTHTWDSTNHPTDEAPAPVHPETVTDPSELIYTIIKSYRIKDMAGNYTDKGTYIRSETVASIEIEDEPLGETDYKVIGWKQSSSGKPSSLNALNWESTVPQIIGETGSSAGHTVLDTQHKYLYVLLEANISDVDADYNYLLSESSITRRINYSYPDSNAIGNMSTKINTVQFVFHLPAHNPISCSGHTWNHDDNDSSCDNYHTDSTYGTCNCGGTHASSCPKKTKSSATCNCGFSNGHTSSCASHNVSSSTKKCDGHSYTCTNFEFADKKIEVNIKNNNATNYPSILASNWSFNIPVGNNSPVNTNFVYARQTPNETIFKQLFNAYGVIMRGDDKLSLAEWKNSEYGNGANQALGSDISSVKFKVSNNQNGTREKNSYIKMFSAQFVADLIDDETQYEATDYTGDIGTQSLCSSVVKVNSLTSHSYSNITVHVDVYSGSQSAASKNVSVQKNVVINNGNTIKSGSSVMSGEVSFIPYITMKYDKNSLYNSTGIDTNLRAYVLGEYTRTLSLNSYAGFEWTKKDNDNITLDSTQWSTHAEANKNHDIGTVLPGGSTLNLLVKNGDRQTVKIVTLQPILAGSGLNQVTNTNGNNGIKSLAEAQSNHKQYVEQAVNTLDEWEIQTLFYNQDNKIDTPTVNLLKDGYKVTNDITVNLGSNTLKTNKETKYYFNATNKGDVDIIYSSNNVYDNSTSYTYYVFYTGENGDLMIFKGNDLETVSRVPSFNRSAGTVVWQRNQFDSAGSICNAEAAEINKQTGIIDKLVAGLERGTGNDNTAPWVNDGRWYNEMLDGIIYVKAETQVKIGIFTPNMRTTVIDPKLCPQTAGKSDMFTKFNTVQFKMKDTVPGSSEKYWVADFIDSKSGQSTGVHLDNMDMLLWSKEIYIPNVNTQDLY